MTHDDLAQARIARRVTAILDRLDHEGKGDAMVSRIRAYLASLDK